MKSAADISYISFSRLCKFLKNLVKSLFFKFLYLSLFTFLEENCYNQIHVFIFYYLFTYSIFFHTNGCWICQMFLLCLLNWSNGFYCHSFTIVNYRKFKLVKQTCIPGLISLGYCILSIAGFGLIINHEWYLQLCSWVTLVSRSLFMGIDFSIFLSDWKMFLLTVIFFLMCDKISVIPFLDFWENS